jgi:D-alanyl-D-alanine dipeptidase
MLTREQDKEPLDLAPIPESPSVAGWKEVPIVETEKSRELLVPVGIFSDRRKIFTSSVYSNEHFNSPYRGGLEGSNTAVFVREGVADRLEKAAELLPRGHHLIAMDAHRTLEVQEALYEQYEGGLKEKHPDWTSEELSAETQKYVSLPSHDRTRPSPHNTGASVDVVIIRVNDVVQQEMDEIDEVLDSIGEHEWQKAYMLEMRRSELIRRNGMMLNFGTRFDFGGSEAALRYFEDKVKDGGLSSEDEEALKNRRLLYGAMIKAGFEPYEDEWWHYNDPASQMGARVAGRDYAEYGAVELSEANRQFEKMRSRHHANSVRLARGEEWTPPKGLEVHYELARRAVFGDNPKNVWRMTDGVDRIEPPKEDQAA